MKNYILFLYFSQIRQSVINKPKNIAALDTLNEPTILNENNAITIGKVLNTHAQRGSPVAPETTATNNATENKQQNFYHCQRHIDSPSFCSFGYIKSRKF